MRILTTMVLCFTVILLLGVPYANAEKLLKAEFVSHTNDDNKDFDSGVYVEVRSNDGQIVIAEVVGGDATKEYKDQSDNTLPLVVKSEGLNMKDCKKFKFRVGMKPNGNDEWKFNGKVTLYFDNKKTLVQDIGDTNLKDKNSLIWTGWAGKK